LIVTGRDVPDQLSADLVVVGAGPAGIVTALEVADAGLDVVVLESGGDRRGAAAQRLGDEAERDPLLHAPMSLATRRGVGGTSAIWGGRCVPYDPIDFEPRPWITDHLWPVSYDELSTYFQRACDWFVCGRAVFDASQIETLPASVVPGLPNGDVRTSALERWSLPTDFGREYRDRLRAHRLRLVHGITCTEISTSRDGEKVDHLVCRLDDGKRVIVSARSYVVACGGLESTRLLLASHTGGGGSIGNHSDHLGRWYMAHNSGVVARIRFATPPGETVHGFEQDVDGVYVHRRFSFAPDFQRAKALPNVTGWLVHPEIADPSHRSGALSLAYLGLASPAGRLMAPEALRLAMTGERIPGVPYGFGERGSLSSHFRNVLRDAGPSVSFGLAFGAKRFVSRGRRVPGFSVYSPDNVYPMQYHAEHLPRRDSRVTLTDRHDALGVPRLRIELRFSDADVDGVVNAHRHWDEYLRRHRTGEIEYVYRDVSTAVRARLGGGFHQTGTTRMSAEPEDGVLDRNLAVHGIPNLHVLSSSAFPTSSQANSTFMIVVFGLRLADRLRTTLA
jgi:choline dehydrogenase-like flavoprotein